eukprot:5474255-Pyramimonas_sp.AAC.1
MSLLAQLIDQVESKADQAEQMILALVHAQRDRVLLQIKEEAAEQPTVDEHHFEWDDEDVLEPSDRCYVDDLSGKVLPADLTQEARMEEIKFIDKIGLWDVVPRPSGVKVIDTRWVDVNKGDVADYQ